MKGNYSRREFIKTGAMGAGLILIGTFSSKLLAAKDGGSKKVTFKPIKKGKKGCTRCEKAIGAILKDSKMKQELTDLMPENSTIYFYVRQFKSSTKVPKNAIAVGSCTKAIKDKVMLFVPGCTRQINTQYVFDSIVKELNTKK